MLVDFLLGLIDSTLGLIEICLGPEPILLDCSTDSAVDHWCARFHRCRSRSRSHTLFPARTLILIVMLMLCVVLLRRMFLLHMSPDASQRDHPVATHRATMTNTRVLHLMRITTRRSTQHTTNTKQHNTQHTTQTTQDNTQHTTTNHSKSERQNHTCTCTYPCTPRAGVACRCFRFAVACVLCLLCCYPHSLHMCVSSPACTGLQCSGLLSVFWARCCPVR